MLFNFADRGQTPDMIAAPFYPDHLLPAMQTMLAALADLQLQQERAPMAGWLRVEAANDVGGEEASED